MADLVNLLGNSVDASILEEIPRLDHAVVMTTVWAVHHDRFEDGRVLNQSRGCPMTEDQMYLVASLYRKVWQLDVSRTTRSSCFLCGRKLPDQEERLCECFRAAHIGTFYTITPQAIKGLIDLKPDTWGQTIVETFQCARCKKLSSVLAIHPQKRFAKNAQPWTTPRLCPGCYENRTRTRVDAAPQKKGKLSVSELVEQAVRIGGPTATA